VASKQEITSIRNGLKAHIGREVIVRANTGRKRIVEKSGVLEQTYPNVFVILLNDVEDSLRRMSFSYIDVLTKTVELEICSGPNHA